VSTDLNLFLIAGELSGDRLGGALMDGLTSETYGNVTFSGVGGPMMQAAGMNSLFDMSDLSVMGLFEILPKIPMLLSRVKTTAQAVIDARPDALITIDSPDFCFRVADKVRTELPDLKVIHYVAPSVWAWRPERAQKMAKHVDHVLALLPFEPPYMQSAGMTCDFVGHPVISEPKPSASEQTAFRAELGLGNGPIITVLPGSRVGEIKRMGPIFQRVLSNIKSSHPDAEFILPVAASVENLVKQKTANWAVKPTLLLNAGHTSPQVEMRKRTAYAISDAALATSGTVALELAAQDCPMVVAYRANWATTRMVKKLAQIDTANLINIVTDTRVVPEHLFENCTVDKITQSVTDLLNGQSQQKDALRDTMIALGKGQKDAHLWAAKSVLNAIP
jgi:lipid-A-disaccharide synthase